MEHSERDKSSTNSIPAIIKMFQIELYVFCRYLRASYPYAKCCSFLALSQTDQRAKCRPFFASKNAHTHLIFLTPRWKKKTFLKRNKVVRSANISHRIAPSKCVNYSNACVCVEREKEAESACSIRTFSSDKYFLPEKKTREINLWNICSI